MRFLPSLPENPHLSDVFQQFPKGVYALLDYHDALLRGPSALSIGERELLAAYVSGLNECAFCFGSHRTYAEAFGFDFDIFDALFADLDSAPIDPQMRPILAYAAKLTKEPHKIVKGDIDAILEMGWSDEAVHDTAVITGLFNLMNRIIFGLGVSDHAEIFAGRHADNQKKSQEERLAENEKALGSKNYRAFGAKIGLKDA